MEEATLPLRHCPSVPRFYMLWHKWHTTLFRSQVTTKKERKESQNKRSSGKKNWVWWRWWSDDERIDEYEIAAGGRGGTERWVWNGVGLGGLIRHNNGDNIMTLSRSWLPWKRSWALARSHCSLDGVDALFFLPYLCPFILSSHLPLSRCCLHRHRGRVRIWKRISIVDSWWPWSGGGALGSSGSLAIATSLIENED